VEMVRNSCNRPSFDVLKFYLYYIEAVLGVVNSFVVCLFVYRRLSRHFPSGDVSPFVVSTFLGVTYAIGVR
jgi:hypothetical protein